MREGFTHKKSSKEAIMKKLVTTLVLAMMPATISLAYDCSTTHSFGGSFEVGIFKVKSAIASEALTNETLNLTREMLG